MNSAPAQDLAAHFGSYETKPGWNEAKEAFTPGEEVTGAVVARARWGVYMDIGSPFPGVLLATRMYPVPDGAEGLPAKGTVLEATIRHFADNSKEIVLTQKHKNISSRCSQRAQAHA